MTVVTLTFTSSEEEISSGIPQTVTIESNIPSTIYYTLDGTGPTVDSPIYVSAINIPDNINSIQLYAFGIDADGVSGPVLSQTFAPDVTRITIARITGSEGFVLNHADQGQDYEDRYDADGAPATFLDVDPETIDFIRNAKGFNGIAEGTLIEVGYPDPDTTNTRDDSRNFIPYSTPEIAELFEPEARVVFIDNRIDNEINVTLRPYGSLNNIYKEFGGKRLLNAGDDAAYVSGGFVRRFFDAKNNIMVSYYFDHNSAQYVKNVQRLPNNIPSLPPFGLQPSSGRPLVFPWIYRGRQTSI